MARRSLSVLARFLPWLCGMTRMHDITIASLLLALGLAAPVGASPRTLELWVRAPGAYGGDAPPGRERARSINLDALPLQQVRHVDVQYEGTFHYRGVPLRSIIAQYDPPPQLDLALLHFRNGMLVPLPFRNERLMGQLDPFLALAMRLSSDAPYIAGQFPSIDRRVESYADARQVTFSGNKLVVSDRLHPFVPEGVRAAFTPWSAVDSLAGVEFVSATAYYRQFDPAPSARPGFELFKQSCQFCHGVSHVGASFGLDYKQPIELYTQRQDAPRLFYHIRYRSDDPTKGRLMPALKHVTEEEAGQLWQWMRSVTSRPMAPYTP